MAKKERTKTRYVDLNVQEGGFVSKFIASRSKPNFSDVAILRKLLSNEKCRILYTLKHKKPKSIYEIAKLLGRDFKSVYEDLKMLERFGLIEFHLSKVGKRESLAPVLVVDNLKIIVRI